MYPSSEPFAGYGRSKVDNDQASFYAGTQARAFRELSFAAGAALYVRMYRPVDIIIRRFSLQVNAGEIRVGIYRGATPSGTWAETIPVLPKNEMSDRPPPIYVPQSEITAGGAFTGGTLYDVIHVKTSGAGGQQLTVGNTNSDQLGAPGGSAGFYKFSNPGNSAATGIFSLWWEELPAP